MYGCARLVLVFLFLSRSFHVDNRLFTTIYVANYKNNIIAITLWPQRHFHRSRPTGKPTSQPASQPTFRHPNARASKIHVHFSKLLYVCMFSFICNDFLSFFFCVAFHFMSDSRFFVFFVLLLLFHFIFFSVLFVIII